MMSYSPRFNTPVVVDVPNAANIYAAMVAANAGSREVVLRSGVHILTSAITPFTPTNPLYIRGEGRGTVLQAPSDATSPTLMVLGANVIGDDGVNPPTSPNTISLLTVDGALGGYAVTVVGGHGIVKGDIFLLSTRFSLSTGAGYRQICKCIEVSATNTLHLDAAISAPFLMSQGSYVTKLNMFSGLKLENIAFQAGANTGTDTSALAIYGCKNAEVSDLHAYGFGGGTGNGTGDLGATSSHAWTFGFHYGSNFDRLTAMHCGDGGVAEFNLKDSSHCHSDHYISEQAEGFGCSYTRVSHSSISNHNVMAPWGRGMKLEAARFCRVSNIEVNKAGQLGTAFYGLGANTPVTGFGLAYNCGYNRLSQIVTLQCLGSGFQTMGSGNTENKMINCQSLYNGLVSGTNADRSAGDPNNYMHGSFGAFTAGWGADGNVLVEI